MSIQRPFHSSPLTRPFAIASNSRSRSENGPAGAPSNSCGAEQRDAAVHVRPIGAPCHTIAVESEVAFACDSAVSAVRTRCARSVAERLRQAARTDSRSICRRSESRMAGHRAAVEPCTMPPPVSSSVVFAAVGDAHTERAAVAERCGDGVAEVMQVDDDVADAGVGEPTHLMRDQRRAGDGQRAASACGR